MGRHFKQVEATPGEHAPAAMGTAQRLRGTLVASLRISRVDLATVQRPGGVDVFLPVTLTLDITDLASGEVVSPAPAPRSREGCARRRAGGAMVAETPGLIAQTMEALVAEAGAAYAPGPILPRCWARFRRAAGPMCWTRGAPRAAHRRQHWPGWPHPVCRARLCGGKAGAGHLAQGRGVDPDEPGPAEMLARPSLLSVVESTPGGFVPAFVRQAFEDAVGSAGGFAPVPVNPAFQACAFRPKAPPGPACPMMRALPDYVATLRVAVLDRFPGPPTCPAWRWIISPRWPS
jgi:hypothetical protein